MTTNNLWGSALPLIAAIAVWGFVHSWLASLQAKALARRRLGNVIGRYYRLGYNIFAVVSFLPVLALLAVLPGEMLYTIPRPWVWVTLALQMLAGIGLVVGVLQTGLAAFLGVSQIFDRNQDETPDSLVVSGLYRWVRHPLYTAGLVILWLTPVMTTSVLIFNLGLTAYLVIGAFFEERKLRREFGVAYQDYQRRTPMFFRVW